MAQILRHHRGGARHAPPVSPVDETGAAPTTRVRLLSTAQPDHRLHSMRGRRLSGAAMEAAPGPMDRVIQPSANVPSNANVVVVADNQRISTASPRNLLQ